LFLPHLKRWLNIDSPGINQSKGNDQVNEEIGLGSNAEIRDEVEENRSDKTIHNLSVENDASDFRLENESMFFVKTGDKKHHNPNNKQNGKRQEVTFKNHLARKFPIPHN
jgi:hypothetical protein